MTPDTSSFVLYDVCTLQKGSRFYETAPSTFVYIQSAKRSGGWLSVSTTGAKNVKLAGGQAPLGATLVLTAGGPGGVAAPVSTRGTGACFRLALAQLDVLQTGLRGWRGSASLIRIHKLRSFPPLRQKPSASGRAQSLSVRPAQSSRAAMGQAMSSRSFTVDKEHGRSRLNSSK